MKSIIYNLDNREFELEIEDSNVFENGKNEIVSCQDTDITFSQKWYEKGYSEEDLFSIEEFNNIKNGINESVKKIISEELNIEVEHFRLEDYHTYVKNDEDHFKVISKTRRLFNKDFNVPMSFIVERLSKILNVSLSDIEPISQQKMHIIVRINRPKSNDFNPPHKDIYESYDNDEELIKFVNFWIPIAGVSDKSNLPLVEGSHRLNEQDISRTFSGGQTKANKYRVRMIKSWKKDNKLVRSNVKYGQVLMFSSHLIHGLAYNADDQKTRVALELRLFESINK